MKPTTTWSRLLGLALTAVMLSGAVLTGCGGGGDDDEPAANAAPKAEKEVDD